MNLVSISFGSFAAWGFSVLRDADVSFVAIFGSFAMLMARVGEECPLGHARSDAARTGAVVDLKFERLVAGVVADPQALRRRMSLSGRTAAEVADLYAFPFL